MESETLAYGPVPSRRLGKSLGVNNIPAKNCSYSCIYCQVGRTINHSIERQVFYPPESLFKAVKNRVNHVQTHNEKLDYITFVPDGEPTLDINLGREITQIKTLGFPVAIITNASLIWQDEVQKDLLKADFVSVKIDALSPHLWKKINRPHKDLMLPTILESIRQFAQEFNGTLVTETMLLESSDSEGEFTKIAQFLKSLGTLKKAYLAIPTRPPLEQWARPPSEDLLNHAYQEFAKEIGSDKVEYLIGYEGNEFVSTGDITKDLLSITAVHPMRKEAIMTLLEKTGAQWSSVNALIAENKLIELSYQGKTYYLRKFSHQ